MQFYGNETDNCVIESIFSGNDQPKVFLCMTILSFRVIVGRLLGS